MKRRTFLGLTGLFAAPITALAVTPAAKEIPARGTTGTMLPWHDIAIGHGKDWHPSGEEMRMVSSRYVEVEMNGKRSYVLLFDKDK